MEVIDRANGIGITLERVIHFNVNPGEECVQNVGRAERKYRSARQLMDNIETIVNGLNQGTDCGNGEAIEVSSVDGMENGKPLLK